MDRLTFSATSSGQRWTYSFSLTTTSAADQVTVYFDSALYRDLQFVASPTGWNTLVIQPDTAIPAAGYFDAIFAPLSAPADFSVSLEYLGTGVPSSQRFDLLDSKTLAVISTGQSELVGSIDTTPPTVLSFSPADDASGVAVASPIVLSFSEAIQRGSGAVVITNLASGTIVESFDAATSSRLNFSGSTLTIDLTADLAPNIAYTISVPAGSVKDAAGNAFAGTSNYNFSTGEVQTVTYTVPGTQAGDFIVPGGGNNYLGGGGSDVYILGGATMSSTVTASFTDTEGSNVVQLVDGTILSASLFLSDALQLTLSTGAKVQVLGASKFSYQLGANAVAGDAATSLSYAQLAAALGTIVPTSGSTAGTAGFVVPTVFTAAAAITPAVAGVAATVPGTLDFDFAVVSGGNNYRGGAGSDTYLIGKHTMVGAVTASIVDTEGANVIQLIDGTVFASSEFLIDALELTLATGAKVQVLGASKFGYQVGANVISSDTAATSSYAQLAVLFGTSVPAVGAGANRGLPNYAVPTQAGAQGMIVADLVGAALYEDAGMSM